MAVAATTAEPSRASDRFGPDLVDGQEEEEEDRVVSSPNSQSDNDDTTNVMVRLPLRRRRSSRDTNRILMSASRNGSLQFRRLEQLFFEEEEENDTNRPRRLIRRKAKTKQAPLVTLRLGKFTLERVYQAPNIYVMDDFLSAADLEYLQSAIASRPFQKSFVDDPSSSESLLDTSHRTSTFLSFQKQENAKVAAIEQKAARLMGCYSTDCIEPLQLVRYLPGQFFGVHHDMGDYDPETGDVALPPRSVLVKRRLVTLFCYLNDLPSTGAGGCTGFPACDRLAVHPKAGRAVLFCNVTREGLPDPRTIHAGQVVVDTTTGNTIKGKTPKKKKDAPLQKEKKKKVKPPIKYGLNIWVCES